MVQKILALWTPARREAQTSRFRSSSVTLSRSTTVMPRVRSLPVSTSMKCADCEVTIDGSIATAMATGSGKLIPCSPVCLRIASCARLLHSIANLATSVSKLRTCWMSDGFSNASPRQRCQPTSSMGRPLLTTMRAASGSHQMLYSAAGVTLPSQQGAPPMTTKRLSFGNAAGRGIAVIAQAIASVKPLCAYVRAIEGFFRAYEHRHVQSTKFRGIKRVTAGLMDIHVSRNGRDGQNLNLGRAQRHNQCNGVIGSCIGINQKWVFHIP